MFKSEKDLEIVSALAKEIAEENNSVKSETSSNAKESDEIPVDHSKVVGADSSQDDLNANHSKKRKNLIKISPRQH